MRWRRMPMEAESPEEYGYERIVSNLAESSCRDRTFADLSLRLDDLVLLYGDHRGLPELRAAIGAEAGLGPDAVLTAAGAAMALFLAHVTLLGSDAHLVVTSPNYATNLETPWAIGGPVTEIPLSFDEGWAVDPDRIAAAMRPNTRLVSVTTPHNPTGTELSEEALRALVALVEKQGAYLLVDETYRDMAATERPVAASRSPRVISVSSVSKTYGVPGIREGWLVCGDPGLVERMLAAKEQIVLTGSVIDEAIALEVLKRRPLWLPGIRAHIARQRGVVADWIAREPRIEWVPPTGGVVAFPRVATHVDMEEFYRRLLDGGVFLGPGHWFGQPARYFRIGWGWPTPEELTLGLDAISAALRPEGRKRGA